MCLAFILHLTDSGVDLFLTEKAGRDLSERHTVLTR